MAKTSRTPLREWEEGEVIAGVRKRERERERERENEREERKNKRERDREIVGYASIVS